MMSVALIVHVDFKVCFHQISRCVLTHTTILYKMQMNFRLYDASAECVLYVLLLSTTLSKPRC
jgi:hypothetical protein